MKYSDGQEAKLGDTVGISGNMEGTVVMLVKEGVAIEGFTPNEWSYLEEGILVETRQAGLIHYPEAYKSSLVLASRALEQNAFGK